MNTHDLAISNLRCIADAIEVSPVPAQPVVIDGRTPRKYLHQIFTDDRISGIKHDASKSLEAFIGFMFSYDGYFDPRSTFSEFSNWLINHLLIKYAEDKTVSAKSLDEIASEMKRKLKNTILADGAKLFIPCRLTPYSSPSFDIGAIHYLHIDSFKDYLTSIAEAPGWIDIDEYINAVKAEHADWMAICTMGGRTAEKTWQVAELSVDLSISILQLYVPPWASPNMARSTARTLTSYVRRMAISDDRFIGGHSRRGPGMSIGEGTLKHFVQIQKDSIARASTLLDRFMATDGALENLEQAWLDAIYWYHEGFAEPLDTIAVTKFVASAEVLVRAESVQGGKQILAKAIKAIYGLDRNDCINSRTSITVWQLLDEFYTARSRLLHGTLSTLTYSVRTTRPQLTGFIHDLLVKYIEGYFRFRKLENYSDDRDAFFDHLESHRVALSNNQTEN